MKVLRVENYIIEEPLINILKHIRDILNNGKLKDIVEKSKELVVTCPNDEHEGGQENNPDCHINLDDESDTGYGVFHCFACNAAGDFTKLVALCFSQSYEYAKQWLIKNYGILAYSKLDLGDDIRIKQPIKKSFSSDAFLADLQEWHPYLAQRKLSRDVCSKFKVKYDPVNRQIVFPVYDAAGHFLTAPRRNIDNKFFILASDIEKPVYALNIIQKNNVKACAITEGPFDCLTGWTYGFPTIATFGAISDEQIAKINKSCLTTIYTLFDNDEAGRKFTRELKNKLDSRFIVHEVKIPNGFKDLNDLDYETFWKIINNAKNN